MLGRPEYFSKRDTPFWRCVDRVPGEVGHDYTWRLRDEFNIFDDPTREVFDRIVRGRVAQFPALDMLPVSPLPLDDDRTRHLLGARVSALVAIGAEIYQAFNPNYPFGDLRTRREMLVTEAQSAVEFVDDWPASLNPEDVRECVMRLWDNCDQLASEPATMPEDNMPEVYKILGVSYDYRDGAVWVTAPGRKLLNHRLAAQRVKLDIVGSKGIADDLPFAKALAEHDALDSSGAERLHDLDQHTTHIVSAAMGRDPDSFKVAQTIRQTWLGIWTSRLESRKDIGPEMKRRLGKTMGAWADRVSNIPWGILQDMSLARTKREGVVKVAWDSIAWEVYYYDQIGIPANGRRMKDSLAFARLVELGDRIFSTPDVDALPR